MDFRERCANQTITEVYTEDIHKQRDWLIINNDIDFYSLEPIYREVLLILQPFLHAYDINYVKFDEEYMNKVHDPLYLRYEKVKYAVSMGVPETIIDQIQKEIDRAYGKGMIKVLWDRLSYRNKMKFPPSPGEHVIFDRGNRRIEYNLNLVGKRFEDRFLKEYE